MRFKIKVLKHSTRQGYVNFVIDSFIGNTITIIAEVNNYEIYKQTIHKEDLHNKSFSDRLCIIDKEWDTIWFYYIDANNKKHYIDYVCKSKFKNITANIDLRTSFNHAALDMQLKYLMGE